MSIELFSYEATEIRTVDIDGQRWAVAVDICAVLDIKNVADAVSRLEKADVATTDIRSGGQMRWFKLVSENGATDLVLDSRKSEARRFRRFLTHEVWPAIRDTGTYSTAPALTGPALMAAALIEAQATLEAKEERIAELEPKALVADKILDATGDYSVSDAAKVLSRSGIKTGGNRLFGDLEGRSWIYRSRHDGKWRVFQTALDAGYMTELPQSHYHPKTGILILDPPQPRVTPKGIARILKDYNRSGELVLT